MPRFNSLEKLQNALLDGTIRCREVVEYYLEQIEKTRVLNAYIEVWPEEALARADALDKRLDAYRNSGAALPGPLFGAVVSLKDNICYADHTVTAASKILEGFSSLYSATAVERMLEADAIIIGRTNCDQFGMGSSNENSVYGPVANAADPGRVPGGSSGGAAVSVQADTCLVAVGSDTGGSIRQPAAFCGLWGIKPTYGRISRYGLIAYGSSFDQIGFIGNNPQDLARFTEVCSGPDEYDSTALHSNFKRQHLEVGNRIAFFPEMLEHAGMEPGVRKVLEEYLEKLRLANFELVSVKLPPLTGNSDSKTMLDYLVPAYYVLITAEASSNLARYDGVRYGYRSPNAQDLEETYRMTRSEGFSDEVKRRILLGTFVLSSGYYDAYYRKAQQLRRLIQEQTLTVLQNCDFILTPVAPTVAWQFGEKSEDPVSMYLADIFTVQASLAGVPALALPAGKHPENGMPVGVQLLAGLEEEDKLFTVVELLMGI